MMTSIGRGSLGAALGVLEEGVIPCLSLSLSRHEKAIHPAMHFPPWSVAPHQRPKATLHTQSWS